jgi:glycosyltransferase involved in cell wall biosynthesis
VKLDVIIATRSRYLLLKSALSSLVEGVIPAGLQVMITIVDNNSSDQTAQVVQEIASRSELPMR